VLSDIVALSGVPPIQDVIAGMRLADLEEPMWEEARAALQGRLAALAAPKGPLWRYARSLAPTDAAADDLFQDALTLAYERLPAFGDRETKGDPFEAWVFGIVKTCHRQTLKRQAKSPTVQFDAETWQAEEHDAFAVSDTADLSGLLGRAIATLPPRQQEIARHTAAGLSGAEIARLTGDAPAAVRKNLSRACQRLGVLFREAGVNPLDFYQPDPASASFLRRRQERTRKARAPNADNAATREEPDLAPEINALLTQRANARRK